MESTKLDDGALTLAYGSDTLELMVRDPTWAHAYWDMGVERISAATGRSGGEEAFLRLIGVPAGHLVAERTVPVRRGSCGLALPEADRSYVVELAVMKEYRWLVLARSGIVHAPPAPPRLAGADRLAVGHIGDVRHLARCDPSSPTARTPGSAQGAPANDADPHAFRRSRSDDAVGRRPVPSVAPEHRTIGRSLFRSGSAAR